MVNYRTLLALSLVGCAYSPDPVIEADDTDHMVRAIGGCQGSFRITGFDEETEAHIRSAGERWNAFMGREGFFTFTPEGKCNIYPYDLPGRLGGSYGYDDNGPAIVFDLQHLTESGLGSGVWFEAVVMHELGHSVAMNHAPNSIMGEGKKQLTLDFSEADRLQCEELGLCR